MSEGERDTMPPEAEPVKAVTIEDRVADVVRAEMRGALAEVLAAIADLTRHLDASTARHDDAVRRIYLRLDVIELRLDKLEKP